MAFVLDILLAFMILRRADDNPKQLSHELSLSKSSLTAVRSGKSFASAAKTTGAGSSSKVSQPVTDRSPLKENEDVPSDDENIPSDDENRDVYYSPQ